MTTTGTALQVQLSDGSRHIIGCPTTVFKTGSRGYRATGKVTAKDGTRYQVNATLVEIGSKPQAETEAA